MENIIEIQNLNKSFQEIHAVQNLSFSVKKGQLFAFLGVNGAGKSTTISMLCGQLTPDSGTILIDGENISKNSAIISKKLGVVFQNSVLDMPLTVKANLKYRAALYGIRGEEFEKRLEALDELLHFKELYRRSVGKLSGGQRRKVDIARALLHDPEILILDEPTTGLDPQTRKTLWDAISLLRKKRGMTVFLTTHYMEEAADADDVIIIDQGQIAAHGTPLYLKNTYTGDFITLYGVKEEEVQTLGYKYEKVADAFRVFVKNTKEAADLLRKHPDLFHDFEIIKGNMDDVFLSVTGKKLGGEN